MSANRSLIVLAVLAAAVGPAGCGPESTAPLTPKEYVAIHGGDLAVYRALADSEDCAFLGRDREGDGYRQAARQRAEILGCD